MTKYLAHNIFTGFPPNVVKFLTLVKDTIISEVNLQNTELNRTELNFIDNNIYILIYIYITF